MYKSSYNRFRTDLLITQTVNQETLAQSYLVKDPISNEIFEFGEEEFFLCKSMDGYSTPLQISQAFKNHFGLSVTEEDFNQFSAQIAEFGLLELCNAKSASSLPTSLDDAQNYSLQKKLDHPLNLPRQKDIKIPIEAKRKLKKNKNKIYLSNSEPIFILLVKAFKPFKLVIKSLVIGIIPLSIVALLTILNNQAAFWHDIVFVVKPMPLVVTYVLTLMMVNLGTRLSQGAVCTYYGAKVQEFGVKLILGFVPRFYVGKHVIWRLKRKEQLWAFGIPQGLRLAFFTLGILTWYGTRGSGTALNVLALALGHAGLINFLINCSPFWLSDGCGLLITYFRFSPKLFRRNLVVWDMMLNRRPLPKWLTFKEKLTLQVFAVTMVMSWAFLAFLIAYHFASGLLKNITPGILGEGVGVLVLCAAFALALRWWLTTQGNARTSNNDNLKTVGHSRLRQSPNEAEILEWSTTHTSRPEKRLKSFSKKSRFWRKHLIKILFIAGFCILFSLPYPYRPGGSIQLLPPMQQQIQAPVEGKISKVFFEGGDGKWIKAGTVIANMEAVDIENAVLTTQEQVRQQQAEVEKQQANLNKLLSTPKKEDVEVAKQQVEVAKQQVEVAKQQVEVSRGELQIAIGKSGFSARQAARFKDLYKTGAFSLQQYENAEKDAETDRNTVEEKKQNVEQKKQDVETRRQNLQQVQANLALVLSGPYPQEIEAARKEVEAAKATLKRLQQQLKYNQEQIQRTALMMPIDGYLITPYLPQKVGVYLEQGDLFAVAEDNRKIQGQVQVPEYDVGEFSLGGKVEIKLLAYPSEPIIGKVVSIEPVASTESTNTKIDREPISNESAGYVKVIVDVPNTKKILKAGMSGYAKIQGSTKPFILAFTRSIVRFVYLEIWSWLP